MRKAAPGEEGQVALRYVNPAATWTQYKKFMIQPDVRLPATWVVIAAQGH